MGKHRQTDETPTPTPTLVPATSGKAARATAKARSKGRAREAKAKTEAKAEIETETIVDPLAYLLGDALLQDYLIELVRMDQGREGHTERRQQGLEQGQQAQG